MALLECKECKNKISSEASSCPICGAPVKTGVKKASLRAIIFIAIILAFFIFYNDKSGEGKIVDATYSSEGNIQSSEKVELVDSTIDDVKEVKSGGWLSGFVSDEMTDVKRPYVYNTSLNGADFDFPYRVEGGSKASIVIRKDANKKVAFISIEKGHMICSYDDCNILIRDKSGKVSKWSASKPQAGVTNTLFINDVKGLEKVINENESIRVGIEFYKYGVKSFDFNVSGYPGIR